MKKLLLIIAFMLLIAGCQKQNEITLAIEKGTECPENVTAAIEEYYKGKNIKSLEIEKGQIGNVKYDIAYGGVEMGRALGYGVWKSKPVKYENACCVAYNSYMMSTDLKSKKIGVPKEFNYSYFVSLDEDSQYSTYNDVDSLISDLKEGLVDAVICTSSYADSLRARDKNLFINDLLDSNIYEYTVVSKDMELINSLDKVIE